VRRFLLVHGAQRILLPQGETFIGRSLGCRVRFNDPAVSRTHLRIEVIGDRAIASNLSDNGTLLNQRRLDGERELTEGDELRLGHQRIRVELVDETEPGPLPAAAGEEEDEEDTSPGEEQDGRVAAPIAERPPIDRTLTPPAIEAIQVHTCPRCRARVSYFEDTCPRCGYIWPPGHPSHNTQRITIEKVRERSSPRYRVAVPVIYSSATLTVDAIVLDVSAGGMFISTELLDPVGTPCEITALPDGHGALVFAGVVAHVADDLVSGRTSGLGIKLVGGSPEALDWLEQVLASHAHSSPE